MNRRILRWLAPFLGANKPTIFGGVLPDEQIPQSLLAPMLLAEVTGPIRHPGTKAQLNSSLVTPQSILRGVPTLEAAAIERQRLAPMELSDGR
jgi:hypothetical protein